MINKIQNQVENKYDTFIEETKDDSTKSQFNSEVRKDLNIVEETSSQTLSLLSSKINSCDYFKLYSDNVDQIEEIQKNASFAISNNSYEVLYQPCKTIFESNVDSNEIKIRYKNEYENLQLEINKEYEEMYIEISKIYKFQNEKIVMN